jgi:hypothetical protein
MNDDEPIHATEQSRTKPRTRARATVSSVCNDSAEKWADARVPSCSTFPLCITSSQLAATRASPGGLGRIRLVEMRRR